MNKHWIDRRIFNLPENRKGFLARQPFFKRIWYWFGYLIEELQGTLYLPLYFIRFMYKMTKLFIINIPKMPKYFLIWSIITF